MRLHFEPVHPEGGNDKLLVALRIDGEMQIAAVGTKARENIVVPIAVIPTPAGRKVFAAVKMSHIEFPRPRLGFGIRQHPLGDEACGLEVGHYLMRRHQVGLAKLVEAVLHVIGRQQAGEIKLHPEEITHRVGVFGASESLEWIDRALREDAFLEHLHDLGDCFGFGLRRLFRRHFAGLEHGQLWSPAIPHRRIARPQACPALPCLLFFRAVALDAVLGEELFQFGFRAESPRQEKAHQQHCPGQPHHDNTSKAPVLSPKRSCSAPNCCNSPRYRLLMGTSFFCQWPAVFIRPSNTRAGMSSKL